MNARVGGGDPLRGLARSLRGLGRAVDRSPLDAIPWLPQQIAWLSHSGREPYLYRAGERQGKTTAGAAELIFRCLGAHPFKVVRRAPVRCALITMSSTQGVAIQRILHELIPKAALVPGQPFSARTGYKGHKRVVEFLNGSSIEVFSNEQGPEAIQGTEYDFVLLDEPPYQEVFDMALSRVRNTGGVVGLTLTPINGPALPWLQALCDSGLVIDYHSPLTPESQISPLTGLPRLTKDGRPWDAAFIAELRERVNPIIAPIVLDGEWERRTEGQFFRCFDLHRHVSSRTPSGTLEWFVGVDFASADRELGMCAVITGVETYLDDKRRKHTRLYVLDEVVLPGTTSMETFASAIVRAIEERGLQWRDLDGVYADNPIKSRFVTASKIELGKWIARLIGVSHETMRPRILSAKEGLGGGAQRSKDQRCRWAYGEISADRVRIHPRCKTLIEGLEKWDYGDRHPLKDVLDAWMYGLKPLWKDSARWAGDTTSSSKSPAGTHRA